MDRTIKRLLWVYLLLLIFEGSLRKWVLPSLADPLLIIRDPVTLAIYAAVFLSGRFPMNGWIIGTFLLAGLSMVASFLAGQDNLLVMAYGLRINYLHLPLIWVMAQVLTRDDVEKFGTFLVILAIPMTALMVLQFRAPMDALINRGVGGDEGGQIYGAAGRIRPPGFFSFITGPQLYFPLAAAFLLHQVSSHRRLALPILMACGLAILVALPISISRTVMLATGLVIGVYALCLPLTGGAGGAIVRAVLMVAVVGYGVSYLPIFSEGRDVFMQRWETAASGSDGDAWGSIIGRILAGFTQPLYWASTAPFFGHGIGVGSNVGARLLSGKLGFLLAEDEWGKVFLELGPIIGGAFIVFRLALTAHLGLRAVGALLSKKDSLPILIFAAAAIPIAQNQWAPPTILGFAIFGGGLLLAALNNDPESDDDEDDDGEEEGTDEETEDEESEEESNPSDVVPEIRPLPNRNQI